MTLVKAILIFIVLLVFFVLLRISTGVFFGVVLVLFIVAMPQILYKILNK